MYKNSIQLIHKQVKDNMYHKSKQNLRQIVVLHESQWTQPELWGVFSLFEQIQGLYLCFIVKIVKGLT